MRSVYAFARRPKWIIGHVLAVVALAVFTAAGLWQLSRHGERSDLNDAVSARQSLPVSDYAEARALSPQDAEYRLVEVTGRYLPDDHVLIRNRSFMGSAGCHLVVPLALSADEAVAVTLGWLPAPSCTFPAIPAGADVTTDDVSLTGRVRQSQTAGRFGARDAAEGRLETMARTDVVRLDGQVGAALDDVYLEIVSSVPDVPATVSILEEPSLDSGPHLGYAVQWFLFGLVVVVGYPLVLRYQARSGDGTPHPLDDAREHVGARGEVDASEALTSRSEVET